MVCKRTRSRAHRRDRRRAKASKWARQGKCGMSGKVGHGPGPAPQVEIKSHTPADLSPHARLRRLLLPKPEALRPEGKRKTSLKIKLNKVVELPELPPTVEKDGWEQYQIDIHNEMCDNEFDLENLGSKPKPR